jgi:hypothetical protein
MSGVGESLGLGMTYGTGLLVLLVGNAPACSKLLISSDLLIFVL